MALLALRNFVVAFMPPLLLTVRAPRRVVVPTAPPKLAPPAAALTVRSRAPSSVLPKLTPLACRVVLAARVVAPP